MKYLYDVHKKDGTLLFSGLTLEQVIKETGLTQPIIKYRIKNPNHGKELSFTQRDMYTGKSIDTVNATFPKELTEQWEDRCKAAEMIRNGTGVIKKVMINGKKELRTVPL